MRLRHCHIPGITSYSHGEKIQQHVVRQFLASKASPTTNPAPDPTVLTLQFSPVYTSGRRENGAVSADQQDYLRAGGRAEYFETLRGGLLTAHHPGQLTSYCMLDLKRHRLSPRSYVCLLEKSLIATCARYGLSTKTTENTGVWIDDEKKIASIGIHLRRNITSHGIGLNVCNDLAWFERITACGLVGKQMTSFAAEGVTGVEVKDVAEVYVRELAERMEGVDDIVDIDESEVMTDTQQ